MKTNTFIRTWVFDPTYRYYTFTVLSAVLLFLVPNIGWNPLLLLWILNGCLCVRESANSKIRYFHLALISVLYLLISFNRLTRLWLLIFPMCFQ